MDAARAFARASAFEHALQERIVERTEPFEWGTAFFHSELPNVWDLNFLRVEDPTGATAEMLARAADDIQGATGLSHRKLAVDDDAIGAAFAPEFRERGWRTLRFVVMAHDGPPPPARDGRVRELNRTLHRRAHEAFLRAEPYGKNDDTVTQLGARGEIVAAAANARPLGIVMDGRVVAMCDLYSDGATAQIEDVGTLNAYRRRGFAREVMVAALGDAYASGHDFVFLVADDEDWPKDFYTRLGFRPIGHYHHFVLPGDTM